MTSRHLPRAAASSQARARGSAVGNILTVILILALIGLGAWLVLKNRHAASAVSAASGVSAPPAADCGRVVFGFCRCDFRCPRDFFYLDER